MDGEHRETFDNDRFEFDIDDLPQNLEDLTDLIGDGAEVAGDGGNGNMPVAAARDLLHRFNIDIIEPIPINGDDGCCDNVYQVTNEDAEFVMDALSLRPGSSNNEERIEVPTRDRPPPEHAAVLPLKRFDIQLQLQHRQQQKPRARTNTALTVPIQNQHRHQHLTVVQPRPRPPQSTMIITEPTRRDVLSGRGKGVVHTHPGNVAFRTLVFVNAGHYARLPETNKRDQRKQKVSKGIVAAIRALAGRFLELDRHSGIYKDIGDNKAVVKTSTALREHQKRIREKMCKATGMSMVVNNPISPSNISLEGYLRYSLYVLKMLHEADEGAAINDSKIFQQPRAERLMLQTRLAEPGAEINDLITQAREHVFNDRDGTSMANGAISGYTLAKKAIHKYDGYITLGSKLKALGTRRAEDFAFSSAIAVSDESSASMRYGADDKEEATDNEQFIEYSKSKENAKTGLDNGDTAKNKKKAEDRKNDQKIKMVAEWADTSTVANEDCEYGSMLGNVDADIRLSCDQEPPAFEQMNADGAQDANIMHTHSSAEEENVDGDELINENPLKPLPDLHLDEEAVEEVDKTARPTSTQALPEFEVPELFVPEAWCVADEERGDDIEMGNVHSRLTEPGVVPTSHQSYLATEGSDDDQAEASIIAEAPRHVPDLPWWRQKLLIGSMMVIMVALIVILGLSSLANKSAKENEFKSPIATTTIPTMQPTTTVFPSALPMITPSVSSTPAPSP